jgi:membrane protein
VRETLRGFRADRGIDLAASLSFTTLLTAVPLLATFSVLVATAFDENDTAYLEFFNAILPYHSSFVTDTLRGFVEQSAALSGIGLVLLLVASLRLIFIVEEIFNAVWGAPRRRAWFARVTLYLFGLLVLALLIGGFGVSLRSLSTGSTFFMELAALTLLYRYVPNAHVLWRSAAIAGTVVAVLLELLRKIFGLYVDMLGRMNLITGSLTLVLLVLFSVYFAWVLILLGVELTHVIQGSVRRRRSIRGPRAGRAENAIRMLLRMSTATPHDLRELYAVQEGSSVEAEELLRMLREGALIRGDRSRGYELARPPERITVAEVVEAVSPDLYTITPEEGDQLVKVLAPLFERLEAERRSLLGTTLADLRAR